MAEDTVIEGGCHCGAIRYRITGELIDAGYCHCDICRQTTGAPVLAWASFPVETFEYLEGAPVVYPSSEWGQREFCGTCGAQLCYREAQDPITIDINIGCLDDPEMFEPEYHVFAAEQLDWLEIDDDLPRYEGTEPDGDEE
ncbi:MAG: GFA family protein [Gammaproteobacteria bacterium]|nr:GFA family protein [Gammaproteobacteria bacterium]